MVKGSFSELHSKLEAIKRSLLAKEDEEYRTKSATHLAFYLDSGTLNRKIPSLKEAQDWLKILGEEAAEKEMPDVQAWIHPLGEDLFIVKFFNLRSEHHKMVNQKLRGKEFNFYASQKVPSHLTETEWKKRERVWHSLIGATGSWKTAGFVFNLYQPSPLTLELLFKNLPSAKSRIQSLAEERVGDEWLTQYPEDEWQNFLFSMIEFLQSPLGKSQVEKKVKEFKSLKLITKLKELT